MLNFEYFDLQKYAWNINAQYMRHLLPKDQMIFIFALCFYTKNHIFIEQMYSTIKKGS